MLNFVACGGGSDASVVQVPGGLEQEVVINVRDVGALADGVSDDEPALQSALDEVARLGGGTVHLPSGIYGIAKPLILRSGVNLSGEGRGRSIVRPVVKSLGKTDEQTGTGVWAAIAIVAADGASISDLTVDLSFVGSDANGISLLPAGADFEGVPSTNCVVADAEVIGGGNYHAYMIWNLRGRGISIVRNVVDGGITIPAESHQEGIESYGGRDVFIAWNVVRNVGNAALNFGSAGKADTGIEGLEVVGNEVSNSGVGLNLGTAMDEAGPQNVVDVRIERNTFRAIWNKAIHVPL